MSGRNVKCSAKGCPGVVLLTTDGAGRETTTPCVLCQRRAEWYAKHGPKPRPTACGICGGRIQLTNGRGGHYKYCAACRPLAHRANIAGQKKRRQERESRIVPNKAGRPA